MVRLTDHLNMTIAVDWDVKPQIKEKYLCCCCTIYEMLGTNGVCIIQQFESLF